MTERDQTRVLFHGAVILLAGLLAGIPMSQAITGGAGEDVVRAWRVAHVGVVAGGLMMIAFAPALRLVKLPPSQAGWLVGALMAAGYGSLGLLLGAAAGARGLEPGHSVVNTVVFLTNGALSLGSLAATLLVLHGARSALQARR
jgi:hypothetical protein